MKIVWVITEYWLYEVWIITESTVLLTRPSTIISFTFIGIEPEPRAATYSPFRLYPSLGFHLYRKILICIQYSAD